MTGRHISATQTVIADTLALCPFVRGVRLHEPTGRHYVSTGAARVYVRHETLVCEGDAPDLTTWAGERFGFGAGATSTNWIGRLAVDLDRELLIRRTWAACRSDALASLAPQYDVPPLTFVMEGAHVVCEGVTLP